MTQVTSSIYYSLPLRMFMCLHAWRYKIGDLVVEAEPPKWAQDLNHVDFVMERRERERQSRGKSECNQI